MDQYSDIGQGIYDAINSQLSANYGLIDGTNDGRQTLPDIARANVNSIKSASSWSRFCKALRSLRNDFSMLSDF